MSTIVPVNVGTSRYQLTVGSHLLAQIGTLLDGQGIRANQAVVITDENVARFGHASAVLSSLQAIGVHGHVIVIPPGDKHKTLATAESMYHELLSFGLRRNGLILAVGGGVVGDVAGFVAATYQRGVRLIQVPTTLLAHDSSIGGKVGVNLSEAKNLVGAFHQPRAVILDVAALATLPPREWTAGMAEVIKHGIIGDKTLFHKLHARPVVAFSNPDDVECMIAQAAAVKVRVVADDERDFKTRMKLNLGHTIGHAVEKVSNYALNHGEAISIGIRMESEIAVARGWLTRGTSDLISSTLAAHGLPVTTPGLSIDTVLDTLRLDKKHEYDHWTFALPFDIGDVRIVDDVTEVDVRNAWAMSTGEERA
jgi:3-dehydroquinate synthase